jgi:hypothetical protein
MTNPDLCFDIWTVRKVAHDDFGQGHWHFNDHINFLTHHQDYETDIDDYIIEVLNDDEGLSS